MYPEALAIIDACRYRGCWNAAWFTINRQLARLGQHMDSRATAQQQGSARWLLLLRIFIKQYVNSTPGAYAYFAKVESTLQRGVQA